MRLHDTNGGKPSGETADFYRAALSRLQEEHIRFLIGGAYATEQYTGIPRRTKDIDIFVLPNDVQAVLQALNSAGAQTELTDPRWLAKAFAGEDFIDIIFNASNGLCPVDETWFQYAPRVDLLNLPLQLCPVEEMIWQKAFIMSRHRYDGNEVAHLLRGWGEQLDWDRLRRRFGEHWPVLLNHLILFRFVYPGKQSVVPKPLMDELTAQLAADVQNPPPIDPDMCRGTFVSHTDYDIAIREWGYFDARQNRKEMPARV